MMTPPKDPRKVIFHSRPQAATPEVKYGPGKKHLAQVNAPDRADLPTDHFSRLTQQLDRAHTGSAAGREALRQAVFERPRDPGIAWDTSFLRDKGDAYVQPVPYCITACATIFQLLRQGHSRQECIAILKLPAVANQMLKLQNHYQENLRDYGRSSDGFSDFKAGSAMFTRVGKAVQKMFPVSRIGQCALPDVKPGPGKPGMSRPAEDLVYLMPLGEHPTDRWTVYAPHKYQLTQGKNLLDMQYAAPRTTPISFQHVLLTNFQPNQTVDLAHAGAPLAGLQVRRQTTPFVGLDIVSRRAGKIEMHFILIDFSNPADPAFFDPNFGWKTSLQGFNCLSIEQALQAIWEYYTWNSVTTKMQGLLNLEQETPRPQIFIASYQICMQVRYDQAFKPAPPKGRWF